MQFNELRLAEPIVRAVAEEGYVTPSPIQSQAIPPALTGRDLLGCAQTGTGKTGAFALPILDRLARRQTTSKKGGGDAPRSRKNPRGGRAPRALVLAPTRELATQIAESFDTYGRHLPLRTAVIFGGVSQTGQVRKLRGGTDIVVATPGRLLDLMGQGCIDLRSIEVLVLDEADRMLDMGFIRDIRRIIEKLPTKRQTMLFSATMPPEIRQLVESILHDPVSVQVAPVAATADLITQSVYHVNRAQKPKLLEHVILEHTTGRTLVFTRTKYGADKLVRVLRKANIDAAAIHGNKTQGQRTRALDGFRAGHIPILVATDIASRGIDVDEITHVINYELPNIPETYVHRIGRTARAGASGTAISLCDPEEVAHLRAIERLIDLRVEIADAPDGLGVAPPPADTRPDTGEARRSAPRKRRSRGGGGSGRGRGRGKGRARRSRSAA